MRRAPDKADRCIRGLKGLLAFSESASRPVVLRHQGLPPASIARYQIRTRPSRITVLVYLMSHVRITAGPYTFGARFETEAAPKTCSMFKSLLPYTERLIHVRWSGEGCWIPLGDTDMQVGFENATSFPAPGHFLLYPGGFSETEILLAYGGVRFASKMGQLAGNHFLTVVEGIENLAALGKLTLWNGAQPIVFCVAE